MAKVTKAGNVSYEQDAGTESDDYRAGYAAGYEAGKQAAREGAPAEVEPDKKPAAGRKAA